MKALTETANRNKSGVGPHFMLPEFNLALMPGFSAAFLCLVLWLVLAGAGGIRLRHLQQLLPRAWEGGRPHPDGARAREQLQVIPLQNYCMWATFEFQDHKVPGASHQQ